MSMETMLNRLEDNQKLIESLDIESPAKSKAGAVNSTEKKKPLNANPAMQQQPRCSVCGLEHDVKQCPRENNRLNQVGEERGKLFPGSDKSKRRDSRQQQKMKKTELEKINREDVTYVLLFEVLDGTIIQIGSAGARNNLRK